LIVQAVAKLPDTWPRPSAWGRELSTSEQILGTDAALDAAESEDIELCPT